MESTWTEVGATFGLQRTADAAPPGLDQLAMTSSQRVNCTELY